VRDATCDSVSAEPAHAQSVGRHGSGALRDALASAALARLLLRRAHGLGCDAMRRARFVAIWRGC
jgi:hypothetical protein